MINDQSRSGSRSSSGTPRMSPISRIGTAAAKSAIRSISPLSSKVSSSSSTSSSMRGRNASSARGVNTGATSLRTLVCKGGSLNTSEVVWCS